MWAGTSALQSIDRALHSVRSEAVQINSQLSNLTNVVSVNQRQRLLVIEKIAQVRLSAIEYGELNVSLTAADKKALETLKLREQKLKQVNVTIEELNQSVVDAEKKREQLLFNVNELAEQLVDIEADVQTRLSKDTTYLAQLNKATEANAVSNEAEQKVSRAQEDMAEKAKLYQADKLFMYLWERKFGTPDYRAGFFARFMDTRVANLIKYNQTRVNFWNLTEIPKRLEDHADHVSNLADQEHEALQQLELDALSEAGADKLEDSIEQARESLDACDDEIESLENQLNNAINERASFVAGEDSYLKESLSIITQALQANNMAAINRYVSATHSLTDDQLVVDLHNIDTEIKNALGNLEDIKRLQYSQSTKLSELEMVRRQFKNARYDDVRSGFNNQSLLVDALSQFVGGLVDGSDLWNVLKRNQRYRQTRSSPTFGSGQFENAIGSILGEVVREAGRQTRRRSGGSTWSIPRSRGSSRRSSSRKRSSGGFRTGGGF